MNDMLLMCVGLLKDRYSGSNLGWSLKKKSYNLSNPSERGMGVLLNTEMLKNGQQHKVIKNLLTKELVCDDSDTPSFDSRERLFADDVPVNELNV